MAETDDTDARLEALETKVAYQDQVIEDLNTAITEQWRELDGLKRLASSLIEQVKEMELGGRLSAGKEPPPPHY
jgi:SlyX protein